MANEFKVKNGLVVSGSIQLKNAQDPVKSGSIFVNNGDYFQFDRGIYTTKDFSTMQGISSLGDIYFYSDEWAVTIMEYNSGTLNIGLDSIGYY